MTEQVQPPVRGGTGTLWHVGWELLLVVGVIIAFVVVIVVSDHGPFEGGIIWQQFAYLGLLASGLALSLRTGTPNLAVGQVLATTGIIMAKLAEQDWPIALAGLVAVLAAVVFGGILALIVGLTRTPAWAVSLGGLGGLLALNTGLTDGQVIPFVDPQSSTAFYVVISVLVALASIVGGALWQLPPVRRALSAHRGDRDSTPWRSTHLLGAVVGMVGSSLLAGLGGVVLTLYTASAAANHGSDGTLLLVLGAVLLGGVSAWGGRGGIAGTVLGLLLLLVIDFGLQVGGQPFWLNTLLAALAILFGVFVGWLLELLGGGSVGRPPLTGRPARLPVPPPPPLADAGVR